jgi:hypothetical protein
MQIFKNLAPRQSLRLNYAENSTSDSSSYLSSADSSSHHPHPANAHRHSRNLNTLLLERTFKLLNMHLQIVSIRASFFQKPCFFFGIFDASGLGIEDGWEWNLKLSEGLMSWGN